MKHSYNIEQKINETLKSLKGISSVSPQPFFYGRLHARMQEELLKPKTVWGFQLKPVYAYSVIVALIIINTFTISILKNHQKSSSPQEDYSLYKF